MPAKETHEPGGMFYPKLEIGKNACRKEVFLFRGLWIGPFKIPPEK